MTDILLGQKTNYPKQYQPDLLFPIERSVQRNTIKNLPKFHGVDFWNAYELSWLENNIPQIAILEIIIPASSPYIVESKSLKLYLNSLNNQNFDNKDKIYTVIKNDLEQCVNAKIKLNLIDINDNQNHKFYSFSAKLIDNQSEISIHSKPSSDILKCEEKTANEALYSNLLKSNCLVTNQPDWASILIEYNGKKINEKSLLEYILSFREHNEFHEHCVERIFSDIMNKCQPQKLLIYARYTRRGGLDINPIRTNYEYDFNFSLNKRQIRQ